jgi:hypothetical protein
LKEVPAEHCCTQELSEVNIKFSWVLKTNSTRNDTVAVMVGQRCQDEKSPEDLKDFLKVWGNFRELHTNMPFKVKWTENIIKMK